MGDWCAGLSIGAEDCDLLRLLVSELVTNAVQHSDGSMITLAALLSEDKVLVTVTDSGTRRLPVMRNRDLAHSGIGLSLVDAFAEEWGVERADDTRAWFVMGLA